MKIAVIGAGLCGVASAYFLAAMSSCQVDLFDEKGLGAGASGVATGLMHPYVGEQVRRSYLATEGLYHTKALLSIAQKYGEAHVADFAPLMRKVHEEEQRKAFLHHAEKYRDVECVDPNTFFLTSGMTVYTRTYLDGLLKAALEKGVLFHIQKIQSLADLSSYDQIVVTAGFGIKGLVNAELGNLRFVKGQTLTCQWPGHLPPLTHTLLNKGHLAKGETQDIAYLGSTYERGVAHIGPDVEAAMKDLYPKLSALYPGVDPLPVIECRSGVRVTCKGHYLPRVGRVSQNVWVMTAMGSRGLLYHALFAKALVESLLAGKENALLQEVRHILPKNKLLSV